jgi:hypothetical protein
MRAALSLATDNVSCEDLVIAMDFIVTAAPYTSVAAREAVMTQVPTAWAVRYEIPPTTEMEHAEFVVKITGAPTPSAVSSCATLPIDIGLGLKPVILAAAAVMEIDLVILAAA